MAMDDINLTINGVKVSVPKGTLIVNAAKKAGINIPVFCYHPKMEPVGMCRMCLVEIGRPVVDRQTGEIQREADGSPKLMFGPKLETACTTPVSEGMVVITDNQRVKDACKATIEFILTSHPLDCPICDKGGECPLQNLTMKHGSAESRFLFDEKLRADKNFPLGDLVFLDRERCIQCGRCVRFQKDIAGDAVLGFFQRGRKTDIVTFSNPGFDSYYSGNTTDICPVGALTTADFRFKARPWEMKPVASLCNHCPVGCNVVFDTRREAKSGGNFVIKRIMPRQNEQVNEIWICDKGRFVHDYTTHPERLTTPLKRENGELVPCSWDEALELVAGKMKEVGSRLLTLVGGRLANEDYYNLAALSKHQNGKMLLYSYMAGGDLVTRFGLESGSNLGDLGKGDAILVVASDLQEEAPIWWLRVKQAASRGAQIIVLNPRKTKLDAYARHVLRYAYGDEMTALAALLPEAQSNDEEVRHAAEAFANAENAVIFYGSEGIGLEVSQSLSHLCAELLLKTRHVGRANNGLIPVWNAGNVQGAWDMGFRPDLELVNSIKKAGVAYVVGANPAADHPNYQRAVETADFLVVQDLFLTETAQRAHVVFPAQAYTEREGTYTSGERRLQRFYQAVKAVPGTQPDYAITARIAAVLGLELEQLAPALILERIAAQAPGYEGMSYQKISEVTEQFPQIDRSDLYYGGTSYGNTQGMGAPLNSVGLVKSAELSGYTPLPKPEIPRDKIIVVPVTRLYDHSRIMKFAPLLKNRLTKAAVWIHPELAEKYRLQEGVAQIAFEGFEGETEIIFDETLPKDVAITPRNTGIPISKPLAVLLKPRVVQTEQ